MNDRIEKIERISKVANKYSYSRHHPIGNVFNVGCVLIATAVVLSEPFYETRTILVLAIVAVSLWYLAIHVVFVRMRPEYSSWETMLYYLLEEYPVEDQEAMIALRNELGDVMGKKLGLDDRVEMERGIIQKWCKKERLRLEVDRHIHSGIKERFINK